jgi:FOG: WD40 repeat
MPFPGARSCRARGRPGAGRGEIGRDRSQWRLAAAGALARLGSLRWRHEESILFVAFVQDGKAVLTGGQDQVFRLWNRATGTEIRHFDMQAKSGEAPGLSPMPWTQQAQVIASVTHDGKTLAVFLPGNEILLWDVDTGKEIRRFTPPQSPVAGLQFSPDGKLLAARSNNNSGVIHLLDPASGKEVRQVKPEGPAGDGVRNFGLGMASSLAFSPDNKLLAVSEAELDQQKVHYYVRVNEVGQRQGGHQDRHDADACDQRRVLGRREDDRHRQLQLTHSARAGHRQGNPHD